MPIIPGGPHLSPKASSLISYRNGFLADLIGPKRTLFLNRRD